VSKMVLGHLAENSSRTLIFPHVHSVTEKDFLGLQ
jgi:hypothetical protein